MKQIAHFHSKWLLFLGGSTFVHVDNIYLRTWFMLIFHKQENHKQLVTSKSVDMYHSAFRAVMD